jgi:hypothetical protein
MMAMMMVLLAGMPECTAFRAYDCNNQSAQIEQYSLLDPEPCGNMDKGACHRARALRRDHADQEGAAGAGHQMHGKPDGEGGLLRVPEPLGSGAIRQVPRPDRD